jgi:uncharacterized membrane protein (UPF0127 family)
MALVLFLGAGACGGDGDGAGETTAATVEGWVSSVGSEEPAGFDTISVTITEPDGEARSMCLYLADTPELRSRGLMDVTDLGGRDGMLFRYDAPHDGRFWMKDTLLPLSIAFYAEDGTFVSATDMDPCPPGTECPFYTADGLYTAAIEVPQGPLGDLGLVPGSSLTLGSSPCG